MTRRTPILAALAAALVSGAAVQAAPQPSVTLRFGDLDLHSQDGRQAAMDRIRTSAREACADLGKGGGEELGCRAGLEARLKSQLQRAIAQAGGSQEMAGGDSRPKAMDKPSEK
jgi:UrcA family protein